MAPARKAPNKKPSPPAKASKAKPAKPSAPKAPPRAAAPAKAAPVAPKPAPVAPKAAPAPPPAKSAPPKVEPKPTPPASAPVVRDPTFVREASPAERKAALEAILKKEEVHLAVPPTIAPTLPAPLPPHVRESTPDARKAAVEALVEEAGVKKALMTAPWKRAAAPTPAPAPPVPAQPQKEAPRATMTKAPLTAEVGKSAPKAVILDTNALMMQFQFHVDIEREVRRILGGNYSVVIPSVVVHELERLVKEGTAKEQGEARMALELAKTFDIVESPGDGDTAVMKLAEKMNAVVVTNDKRLRAVLRAKDIPNIYMRSRAFLTLEGHIPGS